MSFFWTLQYTPPCFLWNPWPLFPLLLHIHMCMCVCIVYIYISKYNLLSLYITCMYVFRDDHSVLDNQLICSLFGTQFLHLRLWEHYEVGTRIFYEIILTNNVRSYTQNVSMWLKKHCLDKNNSNGHVKVDKGKIMKLQPYTKSNRKPRTTMNGRNWQCILSQQQGRKWRK